MNEKLYISNMSPNVVGATSRDCFSSFNYVRGVKHAVSRGSRIRRTPHENSVKTDEDLIFFRLSIHALVAEMAIFCVLYFSASRVQRISDLHSKFALRPHHVPKYGKHPISDR